MFLSFFKKVGERRKRNDETYGEVFLQKNCVSEWLWFFYKHDFFLLANTVCVRKVKNAHFHWHYLFWENGNRTKSPNTTKIRGCSRHTGKPKMALLVSKVPFWEGASTGGFTTCDTQKLCSVESTIMIVLSAKHSFAEIKECNLKKKQNFTKNWGLFANMQNGVLFCFLCFLALWFSPLCCFKPKTGYFPAGFHFSICSPKGPSLKSFFSSYYFFPCFPFVFPFKIPFFVFAFSPWTPLWKMLSFMNSSVVLFSCPFLCSCLLVSLK